MKPLPIQKFDAISERAREKIYALVRNHYQKHPNSPWSGKYLVELEKSIKAFYREMGVDYQEAFRNTLPDEMKEFYDAAVKEIRTAGTYKAVLGEPDAKRVKYFLDSSFQQVAMKTDKMAFDHIRELRKISAEVFRDMSLTGNTRREVSKALLEKAMKIPGFEFIDKSGSKWAAKSYFKMLARTELMNAARASYDEKMADEGFDVMKLTTSGDSCEHCAKWEGRLFSLSGATPGLPTKADLEADGVFHPNCTHSYSLVPTSLLPEDIVRKNTGKNIHSLKRIFNSKPEDGINKFDGIFSNDTARKFDANLRKMPLSNSQIDEFNFHMQKTGHLLSGSPVVKIADQLGAKTDIETGVIQIDAKPYSWDGNRNTISHEWGEMLFVEFNRYKDNRKALESAIASDVKKFDKIPLISISKISELSYGDKTKFEFDLKNRQAHAIFKKKYDDLSCAEQHRIVSFFDVAGSATSGEYGFGHDLINYQMEFDAGRFGNDAFANIYAAIMNSQLEFKEAYPNLWNLVENYLK